MKYLKGFDFGDFLNSYCISAATQLFFHSLAEKVVAKLMADLFLFAFLYLIRRLDSVLPQQKGNDQTRENSESFIRQTRDETTYIKT